MTIIILNNIRSNENVGSIFRTADAVGVSKIILCGYTPAPTDRFGRENKGLTKASLGAEKWVEWEKAESLKVAIEKLNNSPLTPLLPSDFAKASPGKQERGTEKTNFKIIGIEQNKRAINYTKIRDREKMYNLALVFGNEVTGLSEEDLKLCDLVAEIPMRGKKESLNVAVAVGVILYALK